MWPTPRASWPTPGRPLSPGTTPGSTGPQSHPCYMLLRFRVSLLVRMPQDRLKDISSFIKYFQILIVCQFQGCLFKISFFPIFASAPCIIKHILKTTTSAKLYLSQLVKIMRNFDAHQFGTNIQMITKASRVCN